MSPNPNVSLVCVTKSTYRSDGVTSLINESNNDIEGKHLISKPTLSQTLLLKQKNCKRILRGPLEKLDHFSLE